jgi:hypothetical protein
VRVPQYKVNVHVAEFLSRMGLSIRAEEVYRTPVRGVRIPDFTLLHPLVGPMLGEAEVGESEYDPEAVERLRRRVEGRFGDVLFKGYDFILLLIYRLEDLERLAGLEEHRVGEAVGGVNLGVGLAVRGDVFGLGSHYINYYGVPVEVKDIPVVLDKLILEFYSHLQRASPQVRVRIKDLVEGLESIINVYASNLARSFTDKEDLEEGLVERFYDNLYRLIAFRRPELLRFHLEVISRNSVRLGELFEVGSIIDHTTGLHVTRRDERVSAIHEQPALWGSGDKLGIKTVMVDRAPWKVGVVRESDVRVKYWSPRQTFYTANLFVLRRGQLDTQYVLAVNVGEASVSNEWWPLRAKAERGDPHLVEKLLVYMNSTFGFLYLLGERLETEGLWVEYKKQHMSSMILPDLRLAPPPSSDVLEALGKPMSRFKEYLEATARLSERSGKPWYEVAEELVKSEGGLSTRARLDLEVYRWLREVFKVEPPANLYAILWDEVVVLKKVMKGSGGGEVIEDKVEGGSTERHASLDRWF